MYHCRWKAFLRQLFRALKKAEAGRKQTEPGEKILRSGAEREDGDRNVGKK